MCPDNTLPQYILCVIVRRGGKIDHYIGLECHQLFHRSDAVQKVIAHVPDVFANRYRQFFSLERDDIPFIGRFEITVFIEYIIVRQKSFMYFSLYLLFMQEEDSIEKIFAFLLRVSRRAAYQHPDRIGMLPDAIK